MTALLYKEWLKLRPAFLAIVGANALFCLYLFLQIRHHFQVEHAEMLFYQANRIGRLFYADLRYVPLVSGLAIAVAQFAPEVLRGRFRLSIHLPVSLTPLVMTHLAIGLFALMVVLGLELAVLAAAVGVYFPAAFVTSALMTALPWMLAGVAAYFGVAMVFLEPINRYRLTYLALTGAIVWLCHLSGHYNAYDKALGGLILLIALLIPSVLVSAHRFRDGGL